MKLRKLNFCIVSVCAISVLSTGCASIVSKSSYPLAINSTPNKAKISVTDKYGKEIYSGVTPAVLRLDAGAGFFTKAEYSVKFSCPGYDDKIVPVKFSIDGWYFGNILFGGLIGMLIVDPATGAMWKMDMDTMHEVLGKQESYTGPGMQVMDIRDVPEELKEHLVKLN